MNDEELRKLLGQESSENEDQPNQETSKEDSTESSLVSDTQNSESQPSKPAGASKPKSKKSQSKPQDKPKPKTDLQTKANPKEKEKAKVTPIAPASSSTPPSKSEKKPTISKIPSFIMSDEDSDVPLKDRVFLKDFPLTFKQTILCLAVIALLIGIWSFFCMPFFRIKTINIEGNIVLSDEYILERAGIKYDEHLFSNVSGDLFDILSLDYGNLEDELEASTPYIKNIEISVSFPSTINIEVTERNKVAYIRMPDGYAAIDEEGIVIELMTLDDSVEGHAVITGLDITYARLLEPIGIENSKQYQKAIIILGAILASDINGEQSDYNMFDNVQELRMLPSGEIFLTIVLPNNSTLLVKMDSVETINEDMTWLRFAILEGSIAVLPDGSLDLTGEEYIYRPYN